MACRTILTSIVIGLCTLAPVQAGLFLVDFAGDGPNSSGTTPGWNSVNNLVMGQPIGLTDVMGIDNDVTLTALDDGFNPNNPAAPGTAATYDGILVPATARDDYLFKIDDTAGTEARLRIDNLNAGTYNVTLFEGRTSDANQVAKLWVGNAAGSGEPAGQNTGSFAGGSITQSVTLTAGDVLWYKHLEDNSGGISGIIIRQTAVPEPSACGLLALAACFGFRRSSRR